MPRRTTKITKEIKVGKYQNEYLVYSRKSTDDADNQKNSISFQKTTIANFAETSNLSVANLTLDSFSANGFVSEKHSAFKQGEAFEVTKDGRMIMKIERPKFQQLMYFLNRGYIKGVIFYSWDRASRNEADGVALKKLIRQGVDIRFVTAEYDQTSSGALHMDIDDMFSQHHSRVTREKVTETTRKLRSEGKCTYKAPIGYLNQGNVDFKPHDPERAQLIRESAERYATGEWTYHSLAQWCTEQGMTTVPMRRKRTEEEMLAEEEDEVTIEQIARPITYNHVARWLTNRFYTGMIVGSDGTWVQSSSHEAIIPPDLWQRVQVVRERHTVSVHHPEKLPLPYRGLVRCGGTSDDQPCGRAFCPYEQKGNVYYGLRCKAGCSNRTKSVNQAFLEEEIGKTLTRLHFTPDECAELDRDVRGEIGHLEKRRTRRLQQLERTKKALRAKLTFLRTEKLNLLASGAYTTESYLAEDRDLSDQLADLRLQEDISDVAMSDTIKDALKLSELLKSVATYWEHMKSQEREQITRLVFSELMVTEKTVTFQCKDGFKPFERRLFAKCDPTAWLSELCDHKTDIRRGISRLRSYKLKK